MTNTATAALAKTDKATTAMATTKKAANDGKYSTLIQI